ncbi:MAG: hypothetical protein KM310_00750 [Clostridiales bacterium]|nr:hypothetical protein [Clostridiales bacterium]
MVSERIGRDVIYDPETGWFRSVVVPLPGGGKAYRMDWAFWFGEPDTWEARPPFTVTCGDKFRVEWDNGVPADPQDYVVRYPRTNWRPSQAGKPFDYPTGAWFLQELAANGWLDANKIDLSGNLPDASSGGNAWRRQPTLAQVLVAAGVPFHPALESVANWPFPGKLYINLGLEAKPGESKWRVLYWNYTFEVNGRLAEDTFNCKDMPPLDQPPGDDSGPVVRPPGWPEVTCDYRNPAFTSQEGWWKKCTGPRLTQEPPA